MAKLNRAEIQACALEALNNAVGGIRWSDLVRTVHAAGPDTPRNSVVGGLIDLFRKNDTIVKVSRGMYVLARYLDDADSAAVAADAASEQSVIIRRLGQTRIELREKDFYASFAEWLVREAEEVNEAVALGGSVLRGKWGTPDVLGVRRAVTADFVKFETQVVSAEIKIDPSQPVVAFGQAIAYRLFSHKSYLVVPRGTSELDRLTALCTVHGLGLVLFDLDPENPAYRLEVRAQLAAPDFYYVNDMARRLHAADPEAFETLF